MDSVEIKENNFKSSLFDSISLSRSLILGMAILLIMLFHAGIPVPDNKFLKILWNVFCSYGGGIGVTLFIIFSGFGLFVSTFKKNEPITWKAVGEFYKKRAIRILPIYFIVAIIFYAVTSKSPSSFFFNLFLISFWVNGARDFWFIAAIIVLYVFYPLMWFFISKFKNKILPLVILLAVAILFEFIFYYASRDVYNRIEIFIARIPAFMIGLLLGYCYLSRDSKMLKIMSILSLIASLIFTILIFAHITPADNRTTRYFFTFLSLIIIFVISFLKIYIPKAICFPFEFLGRRTLEIYLIHVSWGSQWFRTITKSNSFNIVLYFVISIIVSEIMYELINTKSNLHHYIKTKINESN